MASQNELGRLIAAAVKAALAPLGCRRIGRSRTWISDQRYWAIQIEFQPSGWSKGSYLNVGAAWLWHARKGLPFSVGYRAADFIPFESAEQFAPLLAEMATIGSREVLKLREQFNSFAKIHRYLMDHIAEGWPSYHTAVAAGLAGDIQTSAQLFAQFDAWGNRPHWRTKLESESSTLAALLEYPMQYRSAVQAIINRCREINGLPPDPDCLENLDSTVARQ